MTSVTYHGEYPLDQVNAADEPYIEQYGYEFVKGKSVNVAPQYAAKFADNRFFKVAGKSDKDDVEQGQEEAEQAETDTLRAFLSEHGVPVHHKAGLTKLRELKADYDAKSEDAKEA